MLPEVVVVLDEEVSFVGYAKEVSIRRGKDMWNISGAISFCMHGNLTAKGYELESLLVVFWRVC